MDSSYVGVYRDLYERHWWWRSRERAVLSVIAEVHSPRSGDRVLDVGCGDGLMFDALGAFGEVEGIEIDASAISADNPHRERIHVGTFETFPADQKFRLITALDVLEHLEDPGSYARGIHASLEADGICIVTVPAFRSLWTGHDDLNRHVTRYTLPELKTVLEPAGLRIKWARYLFHWLAIAKVAVRCKERLLGPKVSLPRVPSAPLNWLLTRLTAAELRGGRGLGIPFGSSLLAVVQRDEARR